jgi:KDO2-lipid IV(A) lauroyltransferase
LKRGETVGVLIDQKSDAKKGVKVKFFGRDVYTASIVAVMKEKLDVAVVPIFLARVGEGKYELIVNDPVKKTGDIVQMTQAYNDKMEKIVRKYPSQWFWMHNRWKIS